MSRTLRWTRRILIATAVLLLIAYLALQVSFRAWRAEALARIDGPAQRIDLPSGPMEYEIRGEGQPMLWFHGAPGGHDQGPPFEGMGVISPSRPGYLGTPLSTGRTLREAADAYAELLDALEVDRALVVGISAGGPTALAFATEHPERTRALVLLSAITRERIRPLPERGDFARITDALIGEGFSDWLTVSFIRGDPTILLGETGSEFLSAADQQALGADPAALDALASQLVQLMPLSARRHEGYVNDRVQYARMGEPDPLPITAPTLVIHGTDDPDVSFSHAESAARRIPGAKLVPVEGGGHLIVITRFERVAGALRDFVDTLPVAGTPRRADGT